MDVKNSIAMCDSCRAMHNCVKTIILIQHPLAAIYNDCKLKYMQANRTADKYFILKF